MPKHKTAHAERIYAVIEAQKNRWHTRSEIAELMSRARLTPYDIQCLELLIALGVLMVEQEEGYSRDGYRWRYGVFDAPPDATI